MDHPHRACRQRPIRAGARPNTDSGQCPGQQPRQPPGLFFQIEVTFSPPRPLLWLPAGIAIGHLLLPGGLPDKASLLLKALVPG